MVSLTEENYLKALFHLGSEEGKVNVKTLSKVLGIKMPTVTSMMKKLAEKGLVHYQSYRPLKLTEAGKKEAGLIIRKHRLTEMFLVDKMGFRWDEVHEIAEQVEHIHAAALFEKMDELLGYPTIDPHGSPIPDREGKIKRRKYSKLSDCKPGDFFSFLAVGDSGEDFLKFLNNHELKLGLTISVISLEPFDHSMTVSYGRQKQALSSAACQMLLGETKSY